MDDAAIEDLWGEEHDDEKDMPINIGEIKVKAPIIVDQEFTISYVDQVCDEIERLLNGGYSGEICQNYPRIPLAITDNLHGKHIDSFKGYEAVFKALKTALNTGNCKALKHIGLMMKAKP